jgi:hypothetical protein
MRFVKTNPWFWDEVSTENSEINNKVLTNKSAENDNYKPRTELGKRLMKIREEAIAEGMQLKSLEELEMDNEERKGTII